MRRLLLSTTVLSFAVSISSAVAEDSATRKSASGVVALIYESHNGGGGESKSADISAETSVGETATASATGGAVTAELGLVGSLYTVERIYFPDAPSEVGEGEAIPLKIWAQLDDGTMVQLDPADLALEGSPFDSSITKDGGTIAPVYEEKTQTFSASYLGATAMWSFTAKNLNDDDFGVYAGDGLPDSWQVARFGENDPDGRSVGDKDGDGSVNFEEFAFGSDPVDANSQPNDVVTISLESEAAPEHMTVRLRRRPDPDGKLTFIYKVLVSDDLNQWEEIDAVVSEREVGDGFVEVEIRDSKTHASLRRRFVRVDLISKGN